MRSVALKAFVLLLTVSCVVSAGVKPGQRIIKHLPLDGVPGAVLKDRNTSHYLPDRVIVKLMPQSTTSLSKTTFGIESIDRVLSRAMGVSKGQMFPTVPAPQKADEADLTLLYTVVFSSPNDPFTLAEELSKLPEVQYAEPWFIYPLAERTFTPNDSLYAQQWSLLQVNAPNAWNITQGDSTVVIAIVDSGVEWTHPDLAANIWVNPGETGLDALGRDKRFNGVDDDGDGYVDDWHGWDLVGAQWETYTSTTKGDNDPSPTGSNNDHGTHVAGIVAAVTNNRIGVASLASGCRILPVKTTADDDTRGGGDAYIIAGYQGIVYAATMGAKVINCSWGADGGAQAEQDIIDFATQRGALVVAAAGNESSDAFFSPADYRNVLSVAATGTNDRVASFSNFGDNVDVCAPGVNILSTLYPHTYFQLSGTSMASPLTAALAALVKSKFPAYTSLQVGEQVRVTCDNIDALNSAYAGRLGAGRINALRALSISTLPSVRLLSFAVTDSPGGNGNGVPEPAETLNVVYSFRNYLSPTSSGATVKLSTDSPYLTILNGTFPIPSLGTLDSISNKSTPFRVYVHPEVPASQTVNLSVTVTDGSFTSTQTVSLLINPTFGTHNINDIQLTLTNNGRLGFYDFPTNVEGVGFVFNDANHLFEGGLIIGTSPTKIVDMVRNDAGQDAQDNDFVSNNFFTLSTPGLISGQDGATTFTDGAAALANQIGLRVTLHSYAFSDPVNSKYIILRYDIKNLGTLPVTNLFAGIFLDWDLGAFDKDVSRYEPIRSLGYCFDSSKTRREYVGIRALDSASSFRSLVNNTNIDLTRAGKWSWISGGFSQASAGPDDIHHVMSSGPFVIAAGDSQTVGFALVAGDSSLADIEHTADAAKAKWVALRKAGFLPVFVSGAGQPPRAFSLSANYPNPFNPSTAIGYQLSAVSSVTLKVFDVLGREVATLVDKEQQAGSYKVVWDASGFTSGVYFYRLRAGDASTGSARVFVETKKMVLMK
jgi:serine protease